MEISASKQGSSAVMLRTMFPTSTSLTRRSFIATTALAAGATFVPRGARAQAPKIEVLETKVISQQPEYYHGWPTVARRSNGQLLVTWSGKRQAHVCPFGTVEMMTSDNDGQSWTWPRTLLDSAIDDRDSGVLETAKGTLLATTFTSLAYEASLAKLDETRRPAWEAVHARLPADLRNAELGQWLIRSTDGGLTWSTRLPTIVNSPHGPIQLRDGRLLYAGKELWTGEKRVGVAVSEDDGLTWKWLAGIPTRSGDEAKHYHELHAVECADGKLIAQIRNHNKTNAGETLQSESTDGGKTWSEPHSIGVWGLPSHLLRLRDNRLLMTYGHRRAPLGNQARLSTDNGATWSEPAIISGDGTATDLGYPSTVELADGTLLTVWYEKLRDVRHAVLRQAKWRVS